ncbi:MAG TPA: TonB-dependent receptor [Gemmatimonadales bacterium]|nr:TonB-dependent receptor [Gemmatimonadales bacterium]
MIRYIVRTVACALTIAATASSLLAQSGTIRGAVTDSAGSSLSNAAITVDGTGLRTTTGNQGEYEIRGVPPGQRTVRARLIGFQAASADVTVGPGDEARQDFTLARSTVQLAPIDVVIGSRGRHTASEELAVPVDVFPATELQQQGSTETSVILQAVAPSINFPRQSVTDAGDIVRPFTLRGLSPDHTLVLLNGWRRHQTAVVNSFNYGMGAGSSGVDLNTLPSSALDRIEVLRDGAAAQYGSDAIAGVVNLVLKDGAFSPFVNGDVGRYVTADYPDDGTTVTVNGGWGVPIGRGSLGLFGEFRDRQPTNRAWADPFEDAVTGTPDVINEKGQVVQKNNPVPQPNHHWGDGLEQDILGFANFRMPVNEAGSSEIYSFGGYSHRDGTGNGYRRTAGNNRNWQEIYPLGFLPEINGKPTDYSAAAGLRGVVSGWNYDVGGQFGHNHFDYNIRNTLNASLGPCLDTPCAPGADRVLGTPDDPGIPNQLAFFAGRVLREEVVTGLNVARPVSLGLRAPVNLAFGVAFRRERYAIREGELASYINGFHLDQDSADVAASGSSVFPGFTPTDATDRNRTNFGIYADAETDLTPQLLANVAARLESYSDFGERLTGKLALRYQPSQRVTFRAAASTGFRAPGLSQIAFGKVTTNVIEGEFVDVGVFPVDHPAALALGSRPLEEETAFNFSGGVVVTPVPNLTITADYFHIRINNQILLGATFDDAVTVDILSAAGFSSIQAVQYFTNGLDTRAQGVDIAGNLRVPAGPGGTLDLTASFNVTRNTIRNVDPLPQVLVDAGSSEPGLLDSVTAIGIEDERPDWRGTLQANLTMSRLSALGRFSYYGGFSSAQPGFCDLCRENYGGKGLVDAEVGYRFNFFQLALGVRNLFDIYPDQPSSQVVVDTDGSTAKDFNDNFGIFPWAAASPFGYNGRYIYARTEIQLAP